ncbi:hypothetical protein, partial [Methanothrix sp.]|uniref:hypothetical protein n=1 Tax=Methanothrix sp. TaxID=90426 RepID=UPI003298BD7B
LYPSHPGVDGASLAAAQWADSRRTLKNSCKEARSDPVNIIAVMIQILEAEALPDKYRSQQEFWPIMVYSINYKILSIFCIWREHW